jgi:hypothetical protein
MFGFKKRAQATPVTQKRVRTQTEASTSRRTTSSSYSSFPSFIPAFYSDSPSSSDCGSSSSSGE